MIIPNPFREKVIGAYGADGTAWLESLAIQTQTMLDQSITYEVESKGITEKAHLYCLR